MIVGADTCPCASSDMQLRIRLDLGVCGDGGRTGMELYSCPQALSCFTAYLTFEPSKALTPKTSTCTTALSPCAQTVHELLNAQNLVIL